MPVRIGGGNGILGRERVSRIDVEEVASEQGGPDHADDCPEQEEDLKLRDADTRHRRRAGGPAEPAKSVVSIRADE